MKLLKKIISKKNPIHILEDRLFLEFREKLDDATLKKLKSSVNSWFLYKIKGILSCSENSQWILEESWSSILEKRNDFDPSKKIIFRSWAYNKIIKGKALHFLRDNKKLLHLDITDSPKFVTIESGDFEKEILMKSFILTVYELQNNFRDVILLHYFGCRKLSEIAEMLNSKEDNIKNWNLRAKRKLCNILTNNKLNLFDFNN